MSTHQPGVGSSATRWLPFAPAAFLCLAVVSLLALIPVVYQDPDATPGSSATGSLIFGAINGGLVLAALLGRRNRGALIAVAAGALLIGLLALDGVAAFSTHSRAPWVELPLAWAVFAADMLAALAAVIAAILRPGRAGVTPSGSSA